MAGAGSIPTLKRKLLVIGVYLPPNLRKNSVRSAMNTISDLIMKHKTLDNEENKEGNIKTESNIQKCWKKQGLEKKSVTNRLLLNAKEKYLKREADRLATPGSNSIPHRAVKNLKCGEKPTSWDPSEIFPGADDVEIAEKMATFFNNISNECIPITE